MTRCDRSEGGSREARAVPRIGGLRALVAQLKLWAVHLVEGCPLDALVRNYGNRWRRTAWICDCGRYYSTLTVNHYQWPVRPLLPAAPELLPEDPEE